MQRPPRVPEDWTVQPSKKGGGMKYTNPNNPHDSVRVMPGNPNSPNPAQRVPYVKRIKDGRALDKLGNPVDSSSAEAHIPLIEFHFFA